MASCPDGASRTPPVCITPIIILSGPQDNISRISWLVHAGESSMEEAVYAAEKLVPAMAAVRISADELEGLVADDMWPLPTYQEMLHIL